MSEIKSLNGYSFCDETARAGLNDKIGSSELTSAVESALTAAKYSGEFDGNDGVGVINISIAEV